ncbi:MAG: serine hydrolase [Acidimicrobiia bacterium]|nr:serine hydrolase [Acidimicrobiia bacterium]
MTRTAPDNGDSDGDGDGDQPASDGTGGTDLPHEWETVSVGEAGLDPAVLDRLVDDAAASGSHCLLVTRDGAIVEEHYWNDTDRTSTHEVYSVTKSITALLVGIAADQGLLDIDEPVATYVEEWQGTPSADVTIRNILSNDSGRYHDLTNDFVTLINEDDQTAFAIGLDQQAAPGDVWNYNNAAIQVLDAVLAEATGVETREFAHEMLFEPMGLDGEMKTDPAGNTLTFMGADASCRDLAALGVLVLRDGDWHGRQIVSAEWLAASLEPSQDLNPAYGFLWWLNRDGQVTNPDGAGDRDGGLAPTASMEMVAALGFGNQVLAVYPDSGVVITRIGGFGGSDGGDFSVATIGAAMSEMLVD